MRTIRLMVLAVLGIMAACKSNDKALLTAHEWELQQMEGLNEKPERMPTLMFTDSTAVFGFAGCNRFFWTYTAEAGNKLHIQPGGATMMFCPDMPVEDRFLKGLESIAAYTVEGEKLQLKDAAGKVQMVFVPMTQKQLVGVAEDAHGCNAAAGYTWSEVQKKCIRLFEDGVRLSSVKDPEATLAAYIVFSGDSLKAEVFLPEQNTHPVLDRRNLPGGGFAWNEEDDDTLNVRMQNGVWVIEQRGDILYSEK